MLVILPLFLVFLLIVMVPGLVAMVIGRSIRDRGILEGRSTRVRQ